MQFSTTLRSDLAGAMKALADTGGANGSTLTVYTGASPGVGNAATGTVLATLTAVTFTDNADGTLSVAATDDSSAAADGTPGYCRLANQAGTAYADLTAGVGSGEVDFSAAIELGGVVSLSSGTITFGNA